MNAFWSFFWPIFGFGLLAGVIGGLVGFRRGPKISWADYVRRRNRVLGGVGLGCIVAALLWTGPLGGAERFIAQVDKSIHDTLVYYEMTPVHAQLHRAPLTRRIALAGPADDFQRGALATVMSNLPGVSDASWGSADGGIPLIVEAAIAALVAFLIGLLPAYLLELRRRYNAQWSW
jgi:hypothetical protein